MADVKWKRHRTARSVIAAYFGGMGVKPSDVLLRNEDQKDFSFTVKDMAQGLKVQGQWAFADTKTRTIHYWHDGKRSKTELAFMLGHELGHLSGKPFRSHRNALREEQRADEYGAVAAMVFGVVSKGAR